MNWTQGFAYIFADRKWLSKMSIGALVTAVPVVEAITNGYQLQVIENLKAGHPQPLPEWKNIDRMLGRGFKLWLAINLFYIPSIIISVISWFLGVPLFLTLVGSFITSMATDDYYQAKGISFALSYIVFPLIEMVVAGIAVFLGSIALPSVFFFVPAMALRCQETNSLASTLNIFAHVKFVLSNLGDYVIARLCVLGMLLGMELVASILGGMTFWMLGLGFLIGIFLIAAARFWSRLAWAYFLVNIRANENPGNYNQMGGSYRHRQLGTNQQFGTCYLPANQLTAQPQRYHHWVNN